MTPAEILRLHVAETVTQGDGPAVLIDCTCGAEIHGELPDRDITIVGMVMSVMADHLASALESAE